MSRLIEIRCEFECDKCGKPFSVRLDADRELCPEVPTLYDLAVDAVRGSIDYEGPNDLDGMKGLSAVVGKNEDQCLCGRCRQIRDQKEERRHARSKGVK